MTGSYVRRGAVLPMLAIVAAPLVLTGCPGASMPGETAGREYEGPPDPQLMDLSEERERELAERFERVQAR